LTAWVQSSVWDEINDTNTTGAVIERIDAPAALLDSTVGQIWYQLAASLGLVAIGFAIAVAAVFRTKRSIDRRSAALLLVTLIPPIALSIAFMSDRNRPDQLVYGRYLDTVVWPFFALGLAVVVRRLTARSSEGRVIIPGVAAITLATGVVVAYRHGDQLADDIGLRMMVPGLLPYVGRRDGIPVMTVTLIAVAVLALTALVASRRPPVAPESTDAVGRRRPAAVAALVAVVLIILGFSAVRVHDALSVHLNSWAIGDAVADLEALLLPGEPIGLITDADSRWESNVEQRQRYQVYQLYLPDHELVWRRGPENEPTRFVIAPNGDPDMLAEGAEVRWRDPEKAIALWELP
jgi:hypothetical protein